MTKTRLLNGLNSVRQLRPRPVGQAEAGVAGDVRRPVAMAGEHEAAELLVDLAEVAVEEEAHRAGVLGESRTAAPRASAGLWTGGR